MTDSSDFLLRTFTKVEGRIFNPTTFLVSIQPIDVIIRLPLFPIFLRVWF